MYPQVHHAALRGRGLGEVGHHDLSGDHLLLSCDHIAMVFSQGMSLLAAIRLFARFSYSVVWTNRYVTCEDGQSDPIM